MKDRRRRRRRRRRSDFQRDTKMEYPIELLTDRGSQICIALSHER